jgi:uncharacterized nucleotidyltransferase DUF6036
MAREVPPEPWRSFLDDIDAAANEDLVLHCIGGFAVSLYYGLSRPTGDLDVVEVPPSTAVWLDRIAGKSSELHRKHRLYVQVVTVATLPYQYADRLTEMFVGAFKRLRLFVLDPYDLALSKLSRNLELDLEDVKHLAKARDLDLGLLESRYRQELRPDVFGPVERHDQTLRLWIEAIREARGH